MKILILIFGVLISTSVLAQNYEVKWGKDIYMNITNLLVKEGFEKILRIDEDGFYCYSYERRKGRSIAPSLTKYDYNLNQMYSTEISFADSKSNLTEFFALKDHFALITRIDEGKFSNYYATIINNEGAGSTPVKVFTTHKPTNYPTIGYESTDLFSLVSEDSTHLLFFSNFPQLGKAKEEFSFAVYTNNLTPLYERRDESKALLDYIDTKHKTYKVLLSNKNKLITYSVLYEKDQSTIYKGSSGDYTPLISYYLNIFGKSTKEDKEFKLPQDKYKFYNNIQIKTLSDGKLYLFALCANNPDDKAQAMMIGEIDDLNLTFNLKYYPFSMDFIEKVNEINSYKTDKKDPGIEDHVIIETYLSKNGNLNIVLENSDVFQQAVIALEIKDDKIAVNGILEKSQLAKYVQRSNNVSVFDFVYNDKLYILYNDLEKNLNADKIKKYDAVDNPDFHIILATPSNGSFTKAPITKNNNQGFYLDVERSKCSGNKIILVGHNYEEDKVRLGVLKIE